MTIDSLADLKQVIKACRDGGVTSIEVDGITLTILPKPQKRIAPKVVDYSSDIPEAGVSIPRYTPMTTPTAFNAPAQPTLETIETDELSAEQLMFYSAVGSSDHLTNGN